LDLPVASNGEKKKTGKKIRKKEDHGNHRSQEGKKKKQDQVEWEMKYYFHRGIHKGRECP